MVMKGLRTYRLDAAIAKRSPAIAFEYHNKQHPHSALNYPSAGSSVPSDPTNLGVNRDSVIWRQVQSGD